MDLGVYLIHACTVVLRARVRPLLIIGVERDYLRAICLVPSLTAVLYTSAVYMCTCVLSLCGREVV